MGGGAGGKGGERIKLFKGKKNPLSLSSQQGCPTTSHWRTLITFLRYY